MRTNHRAIEIAKPGTFRLVERSVVAPGEGQVRIRVEACGVCHSDAGTVEGQLPGVVYPSRARPRSNWSSSQRIGPRRHNLERSASASVSDSLVAKTEPTRRSVVVATLHIARTRLSPA